MSDFQGKGSNPRPYDKDKFNDSFDRIFGKKSPEVATRKNTSERDGKNDDESTPAISSDLGGESSSDRSKNNGNN